MPPEPTTKSGRRWPAVLPRRVRAEQPEEPQDAGTHADRLLELVHLSGSQAFGRPEQVNESVAGQQCDHDPAHDVRHESTPSAPPSSGGREPPNRPRALSMSSRSTDARRAPGPPPIPGPRSSAWRHHVLHRVTRARKHPRNQRVRVPHLTGSELVHDPMSANGAPQRVLRARSTISGSSVYPAPGCRPPRRGRERRLPPSTALRSGRGGNGRASVLRPALHERHRASLCAHVPDRPHLDRVGDTTKRSP